MTAEPQLVYIVSAIHCRSSESLSPNCYTITGAYANASAAQAAMLAKAKELYRTPVANFHERRKMQQPEWKEGPFKVEFKGPGGDFGACWVDERVLGVEEMPITATLRRGRGLGKGWGNHGEGEYDSADEEVEQTLPSLLKF